MAERRFVVEVERLDAEVLVLDGLDLARAFFTGDISARPGGYDSMVGLQSPDKILDVDITTVNTTMRARSSHASWAPVIAEAQTWLRNIPRDLDLIEADESEWEGCNGDALLSAAIGPCLRRGIGLAVATKVLHLKRPRLVPILDSLVAQMLGVNPPDGLPPQQRLAGGRRLVAAVRQQGRRNLDVLRDIQAELARDHIERSLVRVFDAIIWYAHPAAGVPGIKRSIRVGLHLP